MGRQMMNECGLEADQRSSEQTLQEGLQENILIFEEEKYDNDLSERNPTNLSRNNSSDMMTSMTTENGQPVHYN